MRNSSRFHKKRSVKNGLPPGTLVHIGDKSEKSAQISVIGYSPDAVEEYQFEQIDLYLQNPCDSPVVWVNVEGVHDVELIRKLGEKHTLHPLVLEDVVNTVQRPKVEDYGDYLFIVLKMLHPTKEGDFNSEQLSIILGPDYLFTFQEGITGDSFDTVRERIRSGKGKIRGMGVDYLAYALIDAIVDGYFTVLEGFGERIVDVEERLTQSPDHGSLHLINSMKKEIIYLRKSVWPLREAISFLERGDSPLLHDATRIYFRDVYDHTVQVIDTVETYRDLLSGMLDLYLSSISNRTNEVMKFLTVIGTIFMPLTFLVGVYGMNFKYLPELEWRNGYFILWGLMMAMSLLMVAYFRKKRWL
ncbi:MAG: magnesium/cobalt transporter CorA [Geobacteraceae bacterium]|nr:magnesium/cobalt transporter CorA [Geobacteraceae bacterium]NTW79498.1 magnesium/cobalt transporter CorA [Geobacteraceae bacterium]